MWVRNTTGENIASQRQRYSDAPRSSRLKISEVLEASLPILGSRGCNRRCHGHGHQESPALGKNLLQKQTPVYKVRIAGHRARVRLSEHQYQQGMWDMTMTMISIRQLGAWAAAAGLCCIVMTGTPAIAEETMTAQSLIDRQLILDQITRYYYNFGKETKTPESSFYAEDGALILGTRRYEGREAVQSAYGGGARPAPAAALHPQREPHPLLLARESPST